MLPQPFELFVRQYTFAKRNANNGWIIVHDVQPANRKWIEHIYVKV